MLAKDKLVLFGAGKIGRSFVAQLFSRGGYEVVFVDVFQPLIDELNNRGNYKVIIKGDKEEILNINNVRGVYAGDEEKVIDEILTARILAVSVGLNGLSTAIQLIAKGLLKRYQINKCNPIDIILAENLRNAAEYLNNGLEKCLPSDYPMHELVGAVETSIGKMVPIMKKKDMEEDILQVFAESYNSLILDKKAFKAPIPQIDGLSPKENMKAWVDRKLFIHNLGHATTAYLGYRHDPHFNFLYEVLEVKEIKFEVKETMLQAAHVLVRKYPDEFTLEDLTAHIDDLLYRFQNKALGDTLFRVGCDLTRKLSSEDRIAGAIHLAIEQKMPYNKILYALVCGCHFRATDEEGRMLPADVEFSKLYEKGIAEILSNVCGFNRESHKLIFQEAEQIERFQ
jgi:mannitol-1-phosphate 5-dehydrogenase